MAGNYPMYPSLADAPPSYSVAVGEHFNVPSQERTVPLHGLTAVDFHGNPGAKFSSLISLANEWLKANIMWQVKKCETVCFPSNAGIADVQKMTYKGSTFAKCLRLWLSPRLYPHAKPQQIVSFAIVPTIGDQPHACETELVQKLNSKLTSTGLNGHILTVQAEIVRIAKRSVNTEELLHVEGGMTTRILRVFYELGVHMIETIGMYDFYPQLLSYKAPNGSQLYEDFPNLMQRVHQWCSAQIVNICNIQSLPIAVVVGGVRVTLRVVRLFTLQSSLPPTELNPGCFLGGPLTCKMFLPVQLTEKQQFRHWNEPPLFETMKQTLIRINTWAKNNNVKIVSADTVAVTLTDDPQNMVLTESKPDSFRIWVIFAYVDGVYSDPEELMCPAAFLKWQQQMRSSAPNQGEQCILS